MNKIVILAAGKGKRMGSELPKALVELKGRPMIKHLLDSIVESKTDPCPIIVVSPDNIAVMKEALSEYNLEYVIQTEQLGTGHAVSSVRQFLSNQVEKISVLFCDQPFITSESIKKLTDDISPTITTMSTVLPDFEEWRQNFYHLGRIIRDADGQVLRIVEFKDASEEERLVREINMGNMGLRHDWLLENIDKLKNNNQQGEYYLTDMVKLAFDQGQKIDSIIVEPREALGINSKEELDNASRVN